MSYLENKSSFLSTNSSNLRASGWDPADWLIEEFLADERENKMHLLTNLCERVESFSILEPGGQYFSTNKIGSSISPSIRTAVRELEVLTFDEEFPLFLVDRSGAAIVDLDLDGPKCFDPNLSAFRAESRIEALWIWAYLNSGLGGPANSYLSTLARKSHFSKSSSLNVLVPEMPNLTPEQADELFALAKLVNSEAIEEDSGKSHFSIRPLEGGTKWKLRPQRVSGNLGNGQLLGSISSQIKRGSSALEFSDTGLPVATGRWLRDGKIREFCTNKSAASQIALPGDILTSAIGDASFSRIATEPMAIKATLFHVKLDKDIDPMHVNSFLNSPEASRQRRDLTDTSMFLSSMTAENLAKLRVVETIDLRDACMKLIGRLVSK